uniref:Ribosomal protein S13 n=1 Tax=Tetrahymena pigmentosa TaxID=5907 RepID=Q09F34_TETPI|nr:ribosomal protein S13 [Tetrahymena pigmentosa]ABI51717.1 ribosomal protein S13 [Tetrahymena pigmentosa]
MKEFFQLNGYIFSKDTNFYSTKNKIYGWNNFTYKIIYDRFEKFYSNNLISYKDSEWKKFKSIILKFFPKSRSIKNRVDCNIFFLDFLNTYRGLRHSKGLPVRGQRTWTNAWSTYRSNLNLRKFKIEIAKRIYGNMPVTTLTTIYMAEQINYMWKLQWKKEWLQARSKRLKLMQNEHNMFKIDINSMSKGYIDGFDKKKELTKKKKSQSKKNVFTLGFEPGFTLFYLKPNNSLSSKEKNKIKIILNEEENRVKIVQKKKKIVLKKKPEKKKKNSSWE